MSGPEQRAKERPYGRTTNRENASAKRRVAAWVTEVAVVGLLAALTVLCTWPMAAHWTSAVLGPPGDNLEYVWKLWWFKEALLTRGTTPFFNPDVFYPYGYPVALSETTTAHTVLGLPLTAWWGEIASYNSLMFLSFVASGYGVYRLLRERGVTIYGGLAGAVAFAFCPYRLAHLGAGHLPLMGTGAIPWLFWALERTIKQPSLRRGLLVGLFYALTALSSWYYAVMVAPFAALYVLLRARPWRRFKAASVDKREERAGSLAGRGGRSEAARLWASLAGGAVFGALLIMPAALPILGLYGRGETSYDFSLRYVDQWSASPLDLVYPNAMHPWWGEALTRGYYQNINENLVYLGWAALALAGVGVWQGRKAEPGGSAPGQASWTRAWAVMGAIAVVLALGTTLHWGGQPVYVRVPDAVEHQFSRAMYVLTGRLALNKVDYGPLQRQGAIVVPLPTLLLYLFVPFMSAMRVWARFGVLAMLAVAVLAGYGADRALARLGGNSAGRRAAAGGAILVLLLVDFGAAPYPYGYSEARGQAADVWLREQGEPGPIIQFPLEKTWYGWMLYPQRVHQRAMAYGYGTFMPKDYEEAIEVLEAWPSQEAMDLLREWGIRYILVGARSYGAEWSALQAKLSEIPALEEVGAFEDSPLHHGDRLVKWVRPTRDVPSTELIGGARAAYLNDEIHVYELR